MKFEVALLTQISKSTGKRSEGFMVGHKELPIVISVLKSAKIPENKPTKMGESLRKALFNAGVYINPEMDFEIEWTTMECASLTSRSEDGEYHSIPPVGY